MIRWTWTAFSSSVYMINILMEYFRIFMVSLNFDKD